ncbi:MAG: DUF4377 domain-containing protein [Paludibacteraceae bacterium]|nr:DUF4377 domain-containing protein [Paludibacteraceae bacterium]
MKKIILGILFSALALPAIPQEFMKVSGELVLTNDMQRCYQIRRGYSRKDKTQWEPFCGHFKNFYYEQGYEYTMHVEKYDAQADTIYVIKTIGRDNSDSYRKQMELKKKREEAAKATQSVLDSQK